MVEISTELLHGGKETENDRITHLIECCGEGSDRSQQEARRALEEIGEPAVDSLVYALLNSGNSTVRWRAAEALGHIGDTRAIEPLIRAMGDRNTAVQWRAIDALADIGEPALEALSEATGDRDVDIRWGADRAMKDIMIRRNMEAQEELAGRVRDATMKEAGRK